MMYLNNEEFKDLDKGIKYLKKAARNNSTGSSFLLGIMYFDKDFYEQDFEEADKWLSKAYRGGFKRMLPYIELMKKSDHFNETNLPDLIDAIKESPITIAEAPPVTIAKVAPIKPVSTKSIPAKSEAFTKTSAEKAGHAPKSNIEVITVYSNLNEILDSQLLSFRYASPEKGAQSTGSRVIGKTCAQTMSCAPTSQADFDRGIKLVMGDHAVAKFSEVFRGYSGF